MSRFDRVDVSVLGKCCIGLIQSRPMAITGERLLCGCGQKLEYAGRWRIAGDQFRATLGEPGTVVAVE